MTKTEAAELMALDVRVSARRSGRTEITQLLVEERISELRGCVYAGTLKQEAARLANVRTTLRLARKDWDN